MLYTNYKIDKKILMCKVRHTARPKPYCGINTQERSQRRLKISNFFPVKPNNVMVTKHGKISP